MSKPPVSGQLVSNARDLNVLLVDGNMADIGFLRSLLGRARLSIHELTEVRTLQAALDALTSPGRAFDVVLLDLGLPDTSGVDGAGRIAQVDPRVPIIALADRHDDLATRGATQHVEDTLVKWDFDPPLLARSIGYAVERHQLRMKLTAEKERAQQASRAKGELLVNLSHEIREPMNVVLGTADILRAGPLSPEQTEQVVRLQNAGDALMDLVDNVVDLSRIEGGHMELASEDFDLSNLVTQVGQLVRPIAVAKGLELTIHVDADLPIVVKGDVRRVKQVLLNLLANAIKVTERGSVELRAAVARNGRVTFEVSHTGPGNGGFGLGLTIAANLVTLMGGTIRVASEVGKGTSFHVETKFGAPKRTASGTMEKTGAADVNALVAALASKASPIRVLLVDDSVDNHELMFAYVAGLPVEVQAVCSGDAALGAFGADVFDLVLVDMHMPGMNGCETLKALRQHERATYAEPTPMLMMSADVVTQTVENARQAGGDGFLAKPVRRNTMLEAILHHCGDAEQDCQAPSSEVPLGQIDSSLLPILPHFLIYRKADCVSMREATEIADFGRVALLAHNLKGTGGAFGFPELSALGGKLENLAKAGNAPEILKNLEALSVLLGRVSRVWEAQTATASASAREATARRLA